MKTTKQRLSDLVRLASCVVVWFLYAVVAVAVLAGVIWAVMKGIDMMMR